MSFFISLGIIILSMVIQGFMQLSPSIFLIFYHNTVGKKSSKRADDFSLFYILGVEAFLTIMFLLIHVISFSLFYHAPRHSLDVLPWVMCGICIALSLISLLFYFRKGKSTELFISRKMSKRIVILAEKTNSRSDAFILGAVSGTMELIFTLPIYFIISLVSMQTIPPSCSLCIILYILVATLPFFVYLFLFHADYNLAEIQQIRTRNKAFYRIIISLCYILIAIATINLGIIL